MPDFGRSRGFWQNDALSLRALGPSHPAAPQPTEVEAPVSPQGARPSPTDKLSRRPHNRGRQDSSQAPGQGPGAEYRIVVVDARKKRDGRVLEEIGKYHPKEDPSYISVVSDRAQYWLGVGAQPSDAVAKILKITGDWQKFKGVGGTEGTLKVAEPKRDKLEIFNEALKDAASEPKAEAVTRKASKKSAEKPAEGRGQGRGQGRGSAPRRPRPRRRSPRRLLRSPPTRPPRVPPTQPRPPRPPRPTPTPRPTEA